jgi:hypothetical protein
VARFSGSGGGEGTPGPEGPAGPPGADANTGDITFDGIQIIGAGTASGDGGGYGTMQLVPDGDLTSDQYLIIDPTAPNHIHIRAGGTQDASTADLILGGENTNVLVSDTGDYVDIRTTSVDSDTYIYRFDSAGYLSGPAMGGLFVSGLLNGQGDLWLGSSDNNVILSPGPENSAYLGDASTVNNQIATIGDIQNTVSNGMVRYSPTFAATGLAFTGSGATYPTYNSYYVKSGSMVSFVIEVDLTTVTNFGTGQYKLQLPFTPAFGFNHFSGWAWADPDVSPDTGTGHTIINADTAGVTDVLDLHYLKSAGGANAPIREGLFLQGTPVTLTTISKIYVNGTYIADTSAP